MITILLLWLYKKYLHTGTASIRETMLRQVQLILSVCLFTTICIAQEAPVKYRVFHKDKQIGTMEFVRHAKGDDVHLRASSSIRAKVLLKVDLNTVDQALFVKGRLISSSVYRHVNGQDKPTKYTRFVQGRYQLIEGRDTQHLDQSSITYTMLMLYCQEPLQMTQVYSDAFQQFLPIRKTGDQLYRVDLPDGNHNTYKFNRGACVEIEVHRTLYTIVMKRENPVSPSSTGGKEQQTEMKAPPFTAANL